MQEDSIIAGDVVFEDLEMENTLLHHDHEQKWYYLSDQQPSEAWVFVQGDNIKGAEHKCKYSFPSQKDYAEVTGGIADL